MQSNGQDGYFDAAERKSSKERSDMKWCMRIAYGQAERGVRAEAGRRFDL